MPRLAGYVGAILGGVAFMAIAGAPRLYITVNLAALSVGLAIAAAGRACNLGDRHRAPLIALSGALLLLASSFWGPPVDGIHRWLPLGPLHIHVGMLVLPSLAVAAQRSASWIASAAVAVASVLVAFQPDRGSALALFTVSLAILIVKRNREALAASLFSTAALGYTVLTRDQLTPVRFVENVLQDAMAYHPLMWVMLSSLLIAAIVPCSRGWKSVRSADLALSACLLGFVIASLLGNYPAPLVGYGASSIIGMALGHALATGDCDRPFDPPAAGA